MPPRAAPKTPLMTCRRERAAPNTRVRSSKRRSSKSWTPLYLTTVQRVRIGIDRACVVRIIPFKVTTQVGATCRCSGWTAEPFVRTATDRKEISATATALLVDRTADPVVAIESVRTIARRHRTDLVFAGFLTDPGWRTRSKADLIAADFVRLTGSIAAGWRLARAVDTDLVWRA